MVSDELYVVLLYFIIVLHVLLELLLRANVFENKYNTYLPTYLLISIDNEKFTPPSEKISIVFLSSEFIVPSCELNGEPRRTVMTCW